MCRQIHIIIIFVIIIREAILWRIEKARKRQRRNYYRAYVYTYIIYSPSPPVSQPRELCGSHTKAACTATAVPASTSTTIIPPMHYLRKKKGRPCLMNLSLYLYTVTGSSAEYTYCYFYYLYTYFNTYVLLAYTWDTMLNKQRIDNIGLVTISRQPRLKNR